MYHAYSHLTHLRRLFIYPLLLLALLLSSCTLPLSPPPPAATTTNATVTETVPETVTETAIETANRPTPPLTKRILVPTPRAMQTGAEATTAVPTVVDSPLTEAQAELLASLPSRGPAPELNNESWFNSAPLKLADLRGNVVMVEFWTYG